MKGRPYIGVKMFSGAFTCQDEILYKLFEQAKDEGRSPNLKFTTILIQFQMGKFKFKPFISEKPGEKFQYYITEWLYDEIIKLKDKSEFSDYSVSHYMECIVYSFFNK